MNNKNLYINRCYNKKIRLALLLLVISALVAFIFINAFFGNKNYKAFADSALSNNIVFSQKLESVNGQEMDQVYNYKFVSDASDAQPMPTGAADNTYNFTMTGNSSSSIGIDFSHAGIYKYKAFQVVDNPKENYTYDSTIYDIEAYVNNNSDGSLSVNYIYKNTTHEKVADPGWTVTYNKAVDNSPVSGTTKTFDFMNFPALLGAMALIALIICCLVFFKRSRSK